MIWQFFEQKQVKILTAGSRIIAFDQQESAFFVKYKIKENQLNIFADDTYPRYVYWWHVDF